MERRFATAVIPISGTDSNTMSVPVGFALTGIITPAALTGTSISLKGNADPQGAAVLPVYNEATLYSVNVGTNRVISLNPAVTRNLSIVAIVSASAEAAARNITLIYTRE